MAGVDSGRAYQPTQRRELLGPFKSLLSPPLFASPGHRAAGAAKGATDGGTMGARGVIIPIYLFRSVVPCHGPRHRLPAVRAWAWAFWLEGPTIGHIWSSNGPSPKPAKIDRFGQPLIGFAHALVFAGLSLSGTCRFLEAAVVYHRRPASWSHIPQTPDGCPKPWVNFDTA